MRNIDYEILEIHVYIVVIKDEVEFLAIIKKNQKPRVGWKKKKSNMKRIAIADIKNELSKYLRLAEEEEIIITRHGKPAGILIGFQSEDDWIDYLIYQSSGLSCPSCLSC